MITRHQNPVATIGVYEPVEMVDLREREQTLALSSCREVLLELALCGGGSSRTS